MRTPILALFALATAVLQAQEKVTYYNNVNSELCFELYRTNDALGAFRVYVVIDGETTTLSDSVLFNTWHTLSRSGHRTSPTLRTFRSCVGHSYFLFAPANKLQGRLTALNN